MLHDCLSVLSDLLDVCVRVTISGSQSVGRMQFLGGSRKILKYGSSLYVRWESITHRKLLALIN
ncbi:hypothetical protein T12_7251 [Trichinella patagoniensis]|uniref:Uncharacterized protein n=1 Tax=Trichinella patagoniensis TaxID=990121 RepID=A0A0V0YVV6_9BILA|nr:hypothetical protein T12_7251 [Trichinella patagoniensis]